jgi:hypothetical protein
LGVPADLEHRLHRRVRPHALCAPLKFASLRCAFSLLFPLPLVWWLRMQRSRGCQQWMLDILAAHFVQRLLQFDMVMAGRLFGDILSDLGPACCSTIGNVPPDLEWRDDARFPWVAPRTRPCCVRSKPCSSRLAAAGARRNWTAAPALQNSAVRSRNVSDLAGAHSVMTR